MKDALIDPLAEKVQLGVPVTGEPLRQLELPASPAAKPVPETATTTPTTDDVGFRVIEGAA